MRAFILGASKSRMHVVAFALLTGAITTVNAHFMLEYPPPWGPVDASNELYFCGNVASFSSIRKLILGTDNYTHAVSNRSEFPLSGGYITLQSGHVNWNRT